MLKQHMTRQCSRVFCVCFGVPRKKGACGGRSLVIGKNGRVAEEEVYSTNLRTVNILQAEFRCCQRSVQTVHLCVSSCSTGPVLPSVIRHLKHKALTIFYFICFTKCTQFIFCLQFLPCWVQLGPVYIYFFSDCHLIHLWIPEGLSVRRTEHLWGTVSQISWKGSFTFGIHVLQGGKTKLQPFARKMAKTKQVKPPWENLPLSVEDRNHSWLGRYM